MRILTVMLVVPAVLFSFASDCRADVVYLKAGGFVEGIIAGQKDGSVEIDVIFGRLRFDSDEVMNCVKKDYDARKLGRYASRACAATGRAQGFWVPNCSYDSDGIAAEINKLENGSEREAYSRIYYGFGEKYMKDAMDRDILLKRNKSLVLARSCFEVVRKCDYEGKAAASAGGAVAEGYRSSADMKAMAAAAITGCDKELSGQIRLPGVEPGVSAEGIIAGLLSSGPEARKAASRKYLEAARYYEKLSKDTAGPEAFEYGQAAMFCYYVASETDPDRKNSNEAWAGYKRCGAYTAAYIPGRAM